MEIIAQGIKMIPISVYKKYGTDRLLKIIKDTIIKSNASSISNLAITS